MFDLRNCNKFVSEFHDYNFCIYSCVSGFGKSFQFFRIVVREYYGNQFASQNIF